MMRFPSVPAHARRVVLSDADVRVVAEEGPDFLAIDLYERGPSGRWRSKEHVTLPIGLAHALVTALHPLACEPCKGTGTRGSRFCDACGGGGRCA